MNARAQKIRIGIAGTGYIAQALAALTAQLDDIELKTVYTHRPVTDIRDPALSSVLLTNQLDEFLESIDCMVECSGDVVRGTDTVLAAFARKLPVVTMNAEMQVVSGSYLSSRGQISEAEGDQPGSEAALWRELSQMGFKPVVFGNIKGFLNHNPTAVDMEYWAAKSGISISQVTSFTDGTKVQIEQALVANGLGATIAQEGLAGLNADNLNEGAEKLAQLAPSSKAISDYLLAPGLPSGVFIVATHDESQRKQLAYYKMGEGPFYTFLRAFHICHMEIPKTIREIVRSGTILLNNGRNPTVNVAAIAKDHIPAGTQIHRAIGGTYIRGVSVLIKSKPAAVPIGLLQDAVILRAVEPGQMLTFDDVALPDSNALTAWNDVLLHA